MCPIGLPLPSSPSSLLTILNPHNVLLTITSNSFVSKLHVPPQLINPSKIPINLEDIIEIELLISDKNVDNICTQRLNLSSITQNLHSRSISGVTLALTPHEKRLELCAQMVLQYHDHSTNTLHLDLPVEKVFPEGEGQYHRPTR